MTLVKSISGYETSCPECGGIILRDTSRGERICNTCGLVLMEREINFGYKRSMYTKEQRETKARTGKPRTVLNINLNSMHRTNVSEIEADKSDLKRILSNDYQYNNSEKALAKGRTILIKINAFLRLPYHVFGSAFLLFKKLKKKADNFQGRRIEALILACIYYIARDFQYPLFISEILKNARTSRQRFKKAYNYIVDKLSLKTPPVKIETYLDKFCYKLNIPHKLHKKVKNYFNRVPRSYTMGKNPRVIIATILYFVVKKFDLDITQLRVAKELDVSTPGIRCNFGKIKEYIEK